MKLYKTKNCDGQVIITALPPVTDDEKIISRPKLTPHLLNQMNKIGLYYLALEMGHIIDDSNPHYSIIKTINKGR